MNDIHWLGVLDIARAIAAKKLSPVEVVRAHLQRIEKLDGRLKSYIAVFADSAMNAARSAEADPTSSDAGNNAMAASPLPTKTGIPFHLSSWRRLKPRTSTYHWVERVTSRTESAM